MALDVRLFSNTLARRIFVLFVVCALLPFAGISIFAYQHVTKQLIRQSSERLRQSAKNHSLSIYERLLSLEADLQMLASLTSSGEPLPKVIGSNDLDFRVPARFVTLARHRAGEAPQVLFGDAETVDLPSVPELSRGDLTHLQEGGVLLLSFPGPEDVFQVAMIGLLDAEEPGGDLLIGKVGPSFLWGIEQGNLLAGGVKALIVDQDARTLFSALEVL